jgi:HD-like signal output (HDOD) protein
MLEPIEIDPKTFLRRHCTLPALPEMVSEIQNMIHDDDVDMGKVADLVSSDPALLAQVLKVANSAYYGLPVEITRVRAAVAFLGLSEIYRMVICLAAVNNLAIREKKELDEFWFHSFFTATCTKYLAKKYEPLISYEELWSAAMLHDIGKLVYLKFFPDHYKAIKNFCNEHGQMFSQAESHFSLPTSAYLGTLLCDHWRLPDRIRQTCEFHTLGNLKPAREGGPPNPFQRMICLGNLLAMLPTDELNNDTRREITEVARTDLDCTEEKFLTMMGDIYGLRTDVEIFIEQFL